MPGVQILFHSSGERVGGPNLPQRGFFVPAVRGAAVRCGDFSAGKGRSGRCRLRAGKRLNRRGVPVCRCAAGKAADGREKDGRWAMEAAAGSKKNPEGACRSPEFFMIRNLRINRAAPVVLPPSGPPNCGPRRLGSWSSCRLRLRCLSARPFWPPAICSGAR